jgi:hypothetical protein
MSHGTRDSIETYLSKEARFGITGHVATPELTSARRRGLELRDTWRRWSSPQQGGEVQDHRTRGGFGAHLCREVWSEATTYVTALLDTTCSLS